MSDSANPYNVLGVAPGASQDEIRRAYLALARRHHPDAGGDAADMRRLNDAWARLSAAPSRPEPRFSSPQTDPVPSVDWDLGDEWADGTWSGVGVNVGVNGGVHDGVNDMWTDRAPTRSRTSRLVDSLTLLALLATVASAALSFLFGMLFESGPLLGFCVYSLFMAGVLVVARTLLAMGYDRNRTTTR